MEVFLIRGWVRNLPGCGKNTTLARGETLAARSLLDSHPTSNQRVRLGFHTARGDIDQGDHDSRPRFVGEVYRYG